MHKKFLVILIASAFYNGVIYSSPVNEKQISDVTVAVQKLPVAMPATASELIKKTESTSITDITPQSQSSELPITINQTFHPVHHVIAQNETHANNNKTITSVSFTKSTDLISNALATNNQTTLTPLNNDEIIPVIKNTTVTSNSTQPSKTLSTLAIKTPTTVKASTSKPTVSTAIPTSTTVTVAITTSKHKIIAEHTSAPVQEKHFDGPSFIGGIVLTIGLTAIGFIAFKYYKSGKIDMNYRTL